MATCILANLHKLLTVTKLVARNCIISFIKLCKHLKNIFRLVVFTIDYNEGIQFATFKMNFDIQ